MTEEEQRQWLRGIQAAEAEELAALTEDADRARDERIARLVLARRRPPRPIAVWARRAVFASAAAAAAIGLWHFGHRLSSHPKSLASYHYALKLRGDQRYMGASEPTATVAKLTADSTLHIDLQPQENLEDQVVYNAYLKRSGTAPIPLSIDLKYSRSGRLQGTKLVSELADIPNGSWDVVFVLARPGGLPRAEEVDQTLVEGKQPPSEGWQLFVGHIELERSATDKQPH